MNKGRMTKIGAVLAAGLSTLAMAAAQPVASASVGDKPAVKVGEKVQNFVLKDTEGNKHDLQKYLDDGKVVVLEWFNPDCPIVKQHYVSSQNMIKTAGFAKENGVVWLAINSGAEGKQGAGLERNQTARKDYKMDYPLLLDEKGNIGRMFGAKTTPDMRIISKDGILIYRGAIDNAKTSEGKGKAMDERTNYVLEGLKSHLAGETVEVSKSKPYGCAVKY